ncbi:mechanosensitive ion channel family protein [Zafaria sp. J156]|uniref:mechanosensitive ion channel family protein n=1 Tax=Zafaria sp. J156 TaxID=3116490 RepID=UPI002E75ED12|nr:mechanosensitive ion channel domain-containing protein [Zafaria sp. J156]MEE1622518.1 mechanosensitive ion channel domain-containing protein [Zafaria sp. J156]
MPYIPTLVPSSLPSLPGAGSEPLEAITDSVEASGVPAEALPWIAVGVAVLAAVVVSYVAAFIVNRILSRHPVLRSDINRCRIPTTLVLSFAGALSALQATAPDASWREASDFLMFVGLIGAIAWLATVLLHLVENSLLAKYRRESPNPRRLSKLRTQVSLLRRVATAVVLTLAVAGILLLIPQVRALGAGILASAGLISVVAGLAVQGTLSNVFAGLQLAFTDAIRVDDVVFVEGKQGSIEEITLTYVVVLLADERRLILPSTHFTTTPFENWSRGSTELSGSILLDLTWQAPVERLRARVSQLLEASELWDGRHGSVTVADAAGGMMQISIFVSARNAADLASLRGELRERLVAELREKYPEALPKPVGPRPPA